MDVYLHMHCIYVHLELQIRELVRFENYIGPHSYMVKVL